MIKAQEIVAIESFSIICKFNNGEVKKLDVDKVLPANDEFAQKILNTSTFNSVRVGSLGQLYWENSAEMKDEKGNIIPCEYDLSPEFVYYNSK